MALIKSALEIALARTENVASDKEGLRQKELSETGKRIASVYLNEHQDPQKLQKELDAVDKADRKTVRTGAYEVLKANFTLPAYKDFADSLKILENGFAAMADKAKEIGQIFQEISRFFQQYVDDREQLLEALRQQLTPMARQKSQQMAAQSGMKVELTPEELPEFGRAYRDNLNRMNEQYQTALDEIKTELDARIHL